MGAGASLNVEEGGSIYEAMKAQEEAKTFYSSWVSEVIAKEFNNLKAKGDLPLQELQHEILLVLKKHEASIMEPLTPSSTKKHHSLRDLRHHSSSKSSTRSCSQKMLNRANSSCRRSFDNLTYDDILNHECATGGRISFSDDDGLLRGKSFVSDDGHHHCGSDTDTLFSRLCMESVRQITSRKNLTHMAAVDGSAGGHVAFQTMMQIRKKLDHVCVFHAYAKDSGGGSCGEEEGKVADGGGQELVRARYEEELIKNMRVPTTKFSFCWEDRKGRNIRKVILQLLSNYKGGVKNPMRPTRHEPNFFFCGYTGAKGARTGVNSTLGSVTDVAVRSVHMPVVICKHLCESSCRVFVIAVDGSENSRNGFDIAMALVNPKDTLYCVTVVQENKPATHHEEEEEEKGSQEPDGDKSRHSIPSLNQSCALAIEELYAAEMRSCGPLTSEFVKLTCGPDETVAEVLVRFSDEKEADFFALSPRARPTLTSVTEYIITTIKANVILCKN